MTKEQFIKEVRANRGKLHNMEEELTTIYIEAIPELKELCISHKLIGVRSMCDLMHLSHQEQYMVYDWMKSKSFQINKHDIDLKVSSIIAESM